ncbi:MAG: GNAT family N-acetyltransferase [Bacillota bacterium]|nr:GNAT family N-acetyltransferase [Bacillota bacterium]
MSTAFLDNYRGIGIGTALIKHMLNETEKRHPDISLSADPDNEALKLYKRCGFIEHGKEGDSIIVLLKRD